ncbi:MAG TPA: PilZ domain-containing protein [Planctomycetota bacterium]|nr:PilZ domain-containing protein [Planctomycetota bacterium]
METKSMYRIELGMKSNVEVSIMAEGRPLLVGRLHDVSAEGAGVVLPNLTSAPLSVGQKAMLVFVGANIVRPLRVSAVVKQRRTEGIGAEAVDHYGFDFTDKEGIDEFLIAQDLHILFNRRRTRRVQPDVAAPIEVLLEDGVSGKSAAGQLLDLSTAGVGLLVTPKVDSRFAGVDCLRLAFRLPEHAEELRLEGTIRYRAREAGGVRYGVEFDGVRTERFREKQAVLEKYVARCLRALLKCGAT